MLKYGDQVKGDGTLRGLDTVKFSLKCDCCGGVAVLIPRCSYNGGIEKVSLTFSCSCGNSFTIEDVGESCNSKRSTKGSVVNDIAYPSLRAACKALEKDYERVCWRLRNNWSLEDAFFKPVKDHTRKVSIGNLEFESLKDTCAHFNRDYHIVSNRLSRGWSMERALNTPESLD